MIFLIGPDPDNARHGFFILNLFFWRLILKLLHIDSSITGQNSVSRTLSANIVAAFKAANPDVKVDYLDLVADAPAHFTMDAMCPRTGQTDNLSPAQVAENAVSEKLVENFWRPMWWSLGHRFTTSAFHPS